MPRAKGPAFQDGLRRWAPGATFASEAPEAAARPQEQRVAQASFSCWRSQEQGHQVDSKLRRAGPSRPPLQGKWPRASAVRPASRQEREPRPRPCAGCCPEAERQVGAHGLRAAPHCASSLGLELVWGQGRGYLTAGGRSQGARGDGERRSWSLGSNSSPALSSYATPLWASLTSKVQGRLQACLAGWPRGLG